MNLSTFCARMGIDEASARVALAAGGHDDSPWYMQAVLGIGAWVTAIAALFFVWLVMDLILGIDEPDILIAVIGTVLFVASLGLLQRRADGAFTHHMAVAFAIAGMLLAVAGVGVPAESVWVAAATALPFAAAGIWQRRSHLLQFLLVSVALILWIAAVWDHWDHPVADLAAVTVPVGVALLLYPPRRDLRPTAFALLTVPLGFELLAAEFTPAWALFYGWPAKSVFLALFGILLVVNLHRLAGTRGWWAALAAVTAAIVVALMLPTGASAALVLLLLAYCMGSRTLAVLGSLAEIYFIWQFYADLQSSLLTKSIVLMSAGAALLLCYGLLAVTARAGRPA